MAALVWSQWNCIRRPARGLAYGSVEQVPADARRPDRDGLQGGFRRQYLDIGKKFNAADRPSPGDRALRGTCSALP